MAVAKITSADVINGLATVFNGSNVPLVHEDTSRSEHIQPSGLTFFDNLNGRFLTEEWSEDRGVLPGIPGDTNAPGPNMGAVVRYAGLPNQRHTIFGVSWSYDSPPTGGSVVIECPSGVPIWGPMAVTASGPGFFPFEDGIKGTDDLDMLVRTTSGGTGVVSTVSVNGHRVE
jgi:hypothetical protein